MYMPGTHSILNAQTIIVSCIFLIFLGFGCAKQEFRQRDLNGTLKVSVYAVNEFCDVPNVNIDQSNFKVTLKGTNPEMTQFTDAQGSCIFQDLPLGTYTISISKDGFGTREEQNFRFIGSKEIDSYGTTMLHKSTTKIKSYKLTISNDTLHVSGVISHNYNPKYYSGTWPKLNIYINKTPDIFLSSSQLYGYALANEYNDTIFNCNIKLLSPSFPSGNTFYIVVCGRNVVDYFHYYDYKSDSYIEPSLGDPSEIKSFIVP